MKKLQIRGYNVIEGKNYWEKTQVYELSPFLGKRSFFTKYPVINDVFNDKNEVIYTLESGEKLLVLTKPQVKVYLSILTNIKVSKMIEEYIDDKFQNKRMFLTTKDHSKFVKDKIDEYRSYNYRKYSFQPQKQEIRFFKLFPMINLLDRNDSTFLSWEKTILGDNIDSMKIPNPPILISNLQNRSEYEQKKFFKKYSSSNMTILNPIYISVEFSPFFKDENTHLQKLKKFVGKLTRGRKFQDLLSYIDVLLKDRTIVNKLDYFVSFLKTNYKQLYSNDFSRRVFSYSLIEANNTYAQNGMYVIRVNGEITHYIHSLKFEEEEKWIIPPNVITGEKAWTKNPFLNYNDCFHYKKYSKLFKLNGKYITIDPRSGVVNVKNNISNVIKENVIKIMDSKKFSTEESKFTFVNTFYVIRKRTYLRDWNYVDLKRSVRKLKGTIRVMGLKKITIIKQH